PWRECFVAVGPQLLSSAGDGVPRQPCDDSPTMTQCGLDRRRTTDGPFPRPSAWLRMPAGAVPGHRLDGPFPMSNNINGLADRSGQPTKDVLWNLVRCNSVCPTTSDIGGPDMITGSRCGRIDL